MKLIALLLVVLAVVGVLSLPLVSSDADLGLDSALVLAPDTATAAFIVIERCTLAVVEIDNGAKLIVQEADMQNELAPHKGIPSSIEPGAYFSPARNTPWNFVIWFPSTTSEESYIANRNTGHAHVEYG